MKFSIVIPAYNGEKYLEKTILSALGQTRTADEIIVHDDNSTDLTAEICKKYSPEVTYHYNPAGPSGFVSAWNKSIALASGDFVSVLHQDDILYPAFLEEIEIALNHNQDVLHIFSLCDYISEKGELIESGEKSINSVYNIGSLHRFNVVEYVKAYQKTFDNLPHIHRCPGVITHRSIFEAGCLYNPDAGHIADDDFFYRVGQFTTVIGIMKSLAAFRIHSGSLTGKMNDISLVKRLAKDYIFQVRQWQNSTFLTINEKSYFEYWVFKYLLRTFYYALITGDKEHMRYGQSLKNELTALNFTKPYFLKRLKIIIIQLLYNFWNYRKLHV
jgi:glycosyltransferase involved in cell wall biosynthesis